MDPDPYRPPLASVEAPPTSAEQERRALVDHEGRLQLVGLLYRLCAALLVVLVVVTQARKLRFDVESVSFAAVELGLAALFFAIGRGYDRFAPWVRWPGTAVSALGLSLIPVGTIVNAWFLYLTWCAKGRRVLSHDYAAIRAATPHLRYRRTTGDWIAVVLVIGVPLALMALFVWVGMQLPKDY